MSRNSYTKEEQREYNRQYRAMKRAMVRYINTQSRNRHRESTNRRRREQYAERKQNA